MSPQECCYDGDLTVHDSTGVEALQSYDVVDGHLVIRGCFGSAFLPRLKRVTGDLRLEDTRLKNLHIRHLSELGGSLNLCNNKSLRSFTAASLVLVGDGIHVNNNKALSALRFPVLAAVGSHLMVAGPNLVELEAPALKGRLEGHLHLGGARLERVVLRQVEVVGADLTLRVSGLRSFELASLSEVEGNLSVVSQPRLERLAMPKLRIVEGALQVVNNVALVSLQLPSLEEVRGTFNISNNAGLESEAVGALITQVVVKGLAVTEKNAAPASGEASELEAAVSMAPTERQRRVIELVIDQNMETREPVPGRWVRLTLREAGSNVVDEVLASCSAWLDRTGHAPLECYVPTLPGLLVGRRAGQTVSFIEGLIGYLRTNLYRDPSWPAYTWASVCAALGLDPVADYGLAYVCIRVGKLGGGGSFTLHGGPPEFRLSVPFNVEAIIECEDIDDFLRLHSP